MVQLFKIRVVIARIPFDPDSLYTTSYPALFKVWAMSDVVLPLPLEPVTPITYLGYLIFSNIF